MLKDEQMNSVSKWLVIIGMLAGCARIDVIYQINGKHSAIPV
jgi:hypothetical protein